MLNASTGGQFAARLTDLLTLTGAAPAVVVVLGIVAIVISAIQAMLMLFRQGALVILAGDAAAGRRRDADPGDPHLVQAASPAGCSR